MTNANDNFKLHRRNDRDTSIHAANAIAPCISEIKSAVLEFAAARGEPGFTDDELNAHFSSTSSTYRSRRAELVAEGWIVDSGLRFAKQGVHKARRAIIWQYWGFSKKEVSA